ncbi:Tat pathway signal sequence domain protein [Streptomyces sp. NPDC005648]|uniref:phage baseplate protein n=1 Tax=Streptomyces sp. NPDC005648 TaxID=3157044 RepID=UPI0033BCED0E
MGDALSGMSRRQLVKWAGGMLGTAALGSAATVALTSGTASAAVAASTKFDLTAPSSELLREIDLQDVRVLQSFSFDNTNKHVYTVNLVQGGRQLPGETRQYTGTERAANGDLAVTRLDLTGAEIGRMYLKGFGHGVAIAAEPSGNSAYLWTETDAVAATDSAGVTNGWGSKLARFKFVNGTVLTSDSSQVTKFSPVSGADRTTIAIDPVNSRLAVRYRVSGVFKFSLYELTAFKAGTFTPLATVTQPTGSAYSDFQGFTTLGQYLYMIDGNAYTYADSTTTTPTNPAGNTYITRIDWNTGSVSDRQLTKAAESLYYREPEGLAIQIPDTSNTAACRLVMGFASENSATDTDKMASFYYKSSLI